MIKTKLIQKRRNNFREECLDLVIFLFRPGLVKEIDHFDRSIIVALMQSSKSVSRIADEMKMNRKTVSSRLKNLRKLDLVTIVRRGRRPLYALSDDFLQMISKAAKKLV